MQASGPTYIQALEKFDLMVTKATALSQKLAGIPSPHGKHYFGSVLFTKLCAISLSLLMSTPKNRLVKRSIDHWDYSTTATLTRNIVDCYFIFYYLCIDKITKSEWGCRWNIFNLHDCLSRKRLFCLSNDTAQVEAFSKCEDQLKSRLLKNKKFMSLTEKTRNHILKGKTLFLLSKDELAIRMDLKKENFRFMYEFLSSQLHSLPVSFYRMDKDNLRGRGLHCSTEENYTKLCILWAAEYLEKAIKDMDGLFSNIPSK